MKQKKQIKPRPLDHSEFWKVIQEAQQGAEQGTSFLRYFERTIHAKQAQDLIQLMDSYRALHHSLDHPALPAADWLINGHTSDDGLCDFKNWVIAQGREVYQATNKNPDFLATLNIDQEARAETLPYTISERYEVLTGKSIYEKLTPLEKSPAQRLSIINECMAKEHCPQLFAQMASEKQKMQAIAREIQSAFSQHGLSPDGQLIKQTKHTKDQSQGGLEW